MASIKDDIRKGLERGREKAKQNLSANQTQDITRPTYRAGNTASAAQTTPNTDDRLEKLRSAYSDMSWQKRRRYASVMERALADYAQQYANDYNNLKNQYAAAARSGLGKNDYRDLNDRTRELGERAQKLQNIMDIFGNDMSEDFRTSFGNLLGSSAKDVSAMRQNAQAAATRLPAQWTATANAEKAARATGDALSNYMARLEEANAAMDERARGLGRQIQTSLGGNPGGSSTHTAENGNRYGGSHGRIDDWSAVSPDYTAV